MPDLKTLRMAVAKAFVIDCSHVDAPGPMMKTMNFGCFACVWSAIEKELAPKPAKRDRTEFCCPECRGSHFGNHQGRISCHDQRCLGCKWKGDGTPGEVWRVFVQDGKSFSSRAEYERAAGLASVDPERLTP